MPVTLEQAKQNAQAAYTPFVIDEFVKAAPLLGALTFDDAVSPTGGSTLVYGYRRLVSQAGAAFRAINTEYVPSEVTTEQVFTELKPLGGSFQVDRILDGLGPAQSGEVTLQMQQKIKGAGAFFNDAVINGDTAVDPDAFEGLSTMLAGSNTEFDMSAAEGGDWGAVTDRASGIAVNKALRKVIAKMDGRPDMLLMNDDAIAALQAVADYTQQLTELTRWGQTITAWNGIPLVNMGEKAGSGDLAIPTDEDGTTDVYAIRLGLDGFHAASTIGGNILRTFLPNFATPGAVKTGEVELGPIAPVLKSTRAAAVLRDVKVG